MSEDEFFVGYLPTPPGIKRFAGRVIVALLAALVASAALVAVGQRDPGEGAWEDQQSVTLRGYVPSAAYPLLRAVDDRGGIRTLLVVEEGKHGADRLLGHRGHFARLTGTILKRGDRMMLELNPGESAIQPISGSPADLAALSQIIPQNMGYITLAGRIVDPKCYLGAMKPGEGKPHKACATLCIRGGIPPMYLAASPGGEPALYLLTGPEGQAIGDALLDHVADAVAISGRVERREDLLIFRIDPATITRR